MAAISNYRNNLLHNSATRVGTTLGEGISSTIPAFIEPKGSSTLVPSTAVITVDPGNYNNPTYTWYTIVNGGTATLISGQTTATYTLPAATFKTTVSTYNLVTYQVVLSQTGYPNKVLEYTIALVREGTDSAVFGINNAAAIFTKNTAGTISPTSITLTTTAVNMSSITSYQWLKDGSVISGATSSSYAVPSTDYSSANTHQYTCNVTGTVNGVAGTVLTDNITIPRLDEVGSAPTPVLTNENVSFPAPVSGYSGISFASGACSVTMYLGSTKLNYAASGASTFSCSIAQSNVTVTGASGTGDTFTVPAPTAMSADSAYVDVTITYRDSLNVSNAIVRRITYALARTGVQGATGNTGNTGSTGASAALLNITTSGALFTKNTAGTITPSTITVATATENITSITGYQWYKDAVAISGAVSSSYAVPSSDYTSTNTHIYRCVVTGTVNGVAGSTREDSITIPRLDNSGTGPTAVLSNEKIAFTAGTSGFSGISFASGSCTVEVYLGATKLNYAASGTNTFSCTNASTSATVAAGSGTGSTFTVPAPTAMSADTAYTDVTVTYRDAAGASNTLVKRINYSLTRAGAQGGTGSTGATGVRGNLELYSTDVLYNSTYTYLSFAAGAASYKAKATALIAAATAGSNPTTPIQNDTVTFSNGTNYVYTVTYNSAVPAWETPGTVIDGSLLVNESVIASKIDSRGLSIKDGSGNVILEAGNVINWSKLGSAASNLSGLGYTGALDANKTYVDASGTIQGVSSGAGTAVNNSLVSTLVLTTTNTTVSGNTFTKTGGTASTWDSQAYSVHSYTGGAYTSFSPINTSGYMMAGLNTDPAANASYTSLDYAIYFVDGTVEIYESGSQAAIIAGGYSTSDIFAITYDGTKVTYYKNGTSIRSVAATIAGPLYFDSSVNTTGGGFQRISFGPMTSNAWSAIGGSGKPADNATVGATIGVNLSGQITPANASTFIANAAINTAQIGELDADKIVARTITTEKIVIGAATANASYNYSGAADINPTGTVGIYYVRSGESVLNGIVPGAKILLIGTAQASVAGFYTDANLLKYGAQIEVSDSYDGGVTWSGWTNPSTFFVTLYNEQYANIYGGTKNFVHVVPVFKQINNPLTGPYVLTNLKFRVRRTYKFTSGPSSLVPVNPNGNTGIGEYARDAGDVRVSAYEFKV